MMLILIIFFLLAAGCCGYAMGYAHASVSKSTEYDRRLAAQKEEFDRITIALDADNDFERKLRVL